MCDHRNALNERDKKWLKKIRVEPYDCSECERQVRMLPKKIRIEEERRDERHEEDEA